MCGKCGCDEPEIVTLEERVLAKNDSVADANRALLRKRGVLALDLVSAPGAGKTTLLERLVRDLSAIDVAVIEGDQETERDAERIRAAGCRAIQINTGAVCHLDAERVGDAIKELAPKPASLLFIENVGNLVCPAMFDLGERAKVVVLSVTEGEDKPLKYPHMFRAAEVMVLSKIDLLPHVDFDVDRCLSFAHRVNPRLKVFPVSVRKGEGLSSLYGWIREGARALEHGGVMVTNGHEEKTVHVLWINAGLSCDGDSVSLTAAMQPSIEDLALGVIPGLPKIALHWPLIDYDTGDAFIEWFFKAERGELDPFVLVVEGSIPNESIKSEGYWAAFGNDPETGQPRTTCEWIDRLAPKATAIVAAGTCATYGGIHAMQGNPTGAMGLADYLGWNFRTKAGLPIVNVPGCPVQPDNMAETLHYLLQQVAGHAPVIPLDDKLRPTWLFELTVHEGCDRAGFYEQGQFTGEYGTVECLVKLGCWGPVVKCNVPKRGWMAGLGGCPNVGGICIGCTMPGFPDMFMPFMDEPPGAHVSSAASKFYGGIVRALRAVTVRTADSEPKWHQRGPHLTTGYQPTW